MLHEDRCLPAEMSLILLIPSLAGEEVRGHTPSFPPTASHRPYEEGAAWPAQASRDGRDKLGRREATSNGCRFLFKLSSF